MKKVLISSAAVLAALGAFAFVPQMVNAETAHVGTRSGVQLRDGTGAQNGQGNGYQSSLETRAKAVNMTTAQLTEALKTKTMDQVRIDQGVSEDGYHAAVRAAATARWEARGLSSDEVKARQTWQAERQSTCDGTGDAAQAGGYGRTH